VPRPRFFIDELDVHKKTEEPDTALQQ